MNIIYICRVTDFQVAGNQIDIPKKVVIDFFNVTESQIDLNQNIGINICHISDLKAFEIIEIQPATNLRWSTKLNSFLSNHNDKLTKGCLLLFEKLGRSYCVHTLKNNDAKYDALVDLFEEGEKHMLLSASIDNQQTDPKDASSLQQIFHGDSDIVFSINELITSIQSTGLIYSDTLIKRLAFSLMAKPFVILSGLAGSGKTQLALAFAKCLSENIDEQVCPVSIGADWTNREPLLGYPNALKNDEYVKPENGVLQLLMRANEDPSKPYFLILDEMNLSVVERYFADFLSAMESGEPIKLWDNEKGIVPKEIALPKNVFITGTINVDETTYMFSPKVLDRANVIEFKIAPEEMEQYLNEKKDINPKKAESACADMAIDFVNKAKAQIQIENGDEKTILLSFFKELKSVNAEFGYRTVNEIGRYLHFADGEMDANVAMDTAILQKLLPKLHGSRKKLEPILKQLWKLCFTGAAKDLNITEENVPKAIFPESADKIRRMYESAMANGFTSFAEA